jgi:hypothetical protein
LLKDWITKDCDLERSWIGGEGIPSRYIGKKKRENMHTTKGSTVADSAGILVQVAQNIVGFSVTVAQNNTGINVIVALML